MDITINEFLRRKRAVQIHQTRSDSLVATTAKNQNEKACKSPDTHFSAKESSSDLSPCAVKVGEKRKRNVDGDGEICNTESRSRSEDVIASLNEDGDAGEELGSRKQLHEVDLCKESLPDAQVGAALEITQNLEADTSSEVAVQSKTSDCVNLKFNDFDKMREEGKFEVGQAWALYDPADGMPRIYALIRKVSAPSFGLRITYLEPDPAGEKEIQWCEEDLPVSVGKFRLGKNQNLKDPPQFSHLIQYNEGINTRYFSNSYSYFTVTPRKGETWALFKNWDIKWSSEPDSHHQHEYEFVEILSDYADEAGGVYVAYLYKAKGFASVFFRMGTGNEDIFRISPRSLYRFSHKIPSFKLTGIEGKGLPKDAYELDQAALPESVEEITVPSNSESDTSSKRQDIYFASKGKVFQTGEIWSFYSGCDDLALYYGRIQKITFTQAYKQEAELKLHISRLKTTPFPEDVINWEDRTMPVGCGTFYARKVVQVISSSRVSHQIMPQISLDGNEYTILPKIGEVWVIYRYWSRCMDLEDLDFGLYDIVEILDDALDYKVQLLEHEPVYDEDKYNNVMFRACTEYKYNEVEGSEPIFTIPKSERIRFSNSVPALRVTKEICGELKDFIRVDFTALPINVVEY